VVGGTNITVDATDPANPIVNADDAAVGGDLSGTVSNAAIGSGVIVNDDINAAAAIAGTKVDAATDAARGTVELATTAEVQVGTDPARVPSVASMVAGGGQVLIAETVLGSDQASVSFSSIPATFRHLRVVVVGRGNDASSRFVRLAFNGDTAWNPNYTGNRLQATGTSATAEQFVNGSTFSGYIGQMPGTGAGAGFGGGIRLEIPWYRSGSLHRFAQSTSTFASAATTGAFSLELWAVRWLNTDAVTSITLDLSAGSFLTGSHFTLYGIG
jgi:hypothetical protein